VGEALGWRRMVLGMVLGAMFLAVFIPVQWYFATFLLSPMADNWFFMGSKVWNYGAQLGQWTNEFWRTNPARHDSDLLTGSRLALCWALAAGSSWLGLLLGGWMRKVQR
jgi:hypothetical protein